MKERLLSEGEQQNICLQQRVTIQRSSNGSSEGNTAAAIALIASSLGLLLSLKDPADKDGAPIFFSSIFNRNVNAFGALVVFDLLAFSTSSGALFLFYTGGVKEARIFRTCSIFCFVASLALLLYAVCSSPA